MSKLGGKRGTQTAGAYTPEAIRDVAESLGIHNIPENVTAALASDVEYRIHQVIEEAARFMRHARRTTMNTSDIDLALRVLNIEPLYGHLPHAPPTFRRALPFPGSSAGSVYFVEDEEIDFDRVLREEKIALPKGVTFTAHWLAVEGLQPLVPENPPAIPRDIPTDQTVNGSATESRANAKKTLQQQQLVKQVLSRELQLYYTRLTSSLLPPSQSGHTQRQAALASLRNDAGLQALLPYLVRWVGEGVVSALKEGVQSETDGRTLEVLMEVIGAILDNGQLFIEPYLHQVLPPILSTLLHSALPPSHATHLRTLASNTLSRLLTQHGITYPSLSPRIMKTLLLALISEGKSRGTREGAIRGLVGVGKEAVRKGLVEGGGAIVVGRECAVNASDDLPKAVMEAFKLIHPPSPLPFAATNSEKDMLVVKALHEQLGPYFGAQLTNDIEWGQKILGL